MRREAERGGEGGGVRAWSRQPSLLQAARPGALCGRRKVERQLRDRAWGLAQKAPSRAEKAPLAFSRKSSQLRVAPSGMIPVHRKSKWVGNQRWSCPF